MQAPVVVVNQNSQRETGRKAQLSNVKAGKAVADIIRTTLGPRSMLKMLLDPMGGIVMTNDGHAILREIDVSHPAAKSMIELSRSQDEEVGDGTTSVIILAGEMLAAAEPFLERKMHPTVIVAAFRKALDDGLKFMEDAAFNVDLKNRESMRKIMMSTLGTKFIGRFGPIMCDLAIDAVEKVVDEVGDHVEIDTKRFAKIEKIPGGELEDCKVLNGVMINKDVTHPKMKRRIQNPRVLLLDCPLEYKKNESQTMMEFSKEEDFETALRMEEEYIEKICKDIIKFKPDVVITEKGLSDLAQHYFIKAGITALRRLRKTDNIRVARATGATIVHRTEDIRESDVGTAGLFEVRKLGDEYFTFIVDCKEPKACTIVLRGASKDVLNEVERNLHDAMAVARNIFMDPKLVPGGGAIEMAVAQHLVEHSKFIDGVQQWPYKAVGMALEVIPRTLAQNCGASVVRTVTELRAKHANGQNVAFGINGETGDICDVRADEVGIWEPLVVKTQTLKTAVEAACMLLRIDDIVSGVSKTKKDGGAPAPHPEDA